MKCKVLNSVKSNFKFRQKKGSETELIPRFDIGFIYVHNTKA